MKSSEKERLIKLDILSIENRLRHAFNQGYDYGYKQGIEKSKKQSKIGHWVDKNIRGSIEPYCSVCGDSVDTIYHYNYCPNCGIKMEVEGGSFGAYLKQAVQNRFCSLFRNFAAKNMVCTGDTEDCRGEITRTYMIDESFQDYREKQKIRNADLYRRNAAKIDEERAAQGLPKIYRRSLATPEEKAEHDAEVKERARECARRYQKEHKKELAEKKAAYYQNPENKERYRLNSAILRARKSIERFESAGDTKRAAEARERLARYQAEKENLKAS